MRIGIDLDNTLVCYDQLFWRLAVDRGWIPAGIPARKDCVRDELRRRGREDDWVILQGEVYGSGMTAAVPFPGALEALHAFRERGWTAFVVSHRTVTPVAGPPADLHECARRWLRERRFLDEMQTGLRADSIMFRATKAEKLASIASLKLDWFIDDLPELLLEPGFPADVQRVLFDPHQRRPSLPDSVRVAHDWRDMTALLAGVSAS